MPSATAKPLHADSLPAGSPAARARAGWRIGFVIALLVAATATHWPRLQVGTPQEPIDKLLHASSYAALMLFLWQAQWTHRILACAAMLAAWGALDEVTQSLPALGRSADMDDWAADLIGVLLMSGFLAALRPQGRGLARLLELRRARARDWLFSRPLTWMHFTVVFLLGAITAGPLAVFLDSLLIRKPPQPWEFGLVGGVLGGAVAAHLLLEFGVRYATPRCARELSCLRCGGAAATARHGAAQASQGIVPPTVAAGPCSHCGAPRERTDWAASAALDGSEAARLCFVPIAQGLVILVVVDLGVLALFSFARLDSAPVLAMDTWYRSLSGDMRMLGDIASIALISAWTLWRCRRRLAARVDTGGERCLSCGFDLHASAVGNPTGECQECGAPFLRVPALTKLPP